MRSAIAEQEDKEAMAEYCTQMTEQVKKSLEPLGCKF